MILSKLSKHFFNSLLCLALLMAPPSCDNHPPFQKKLSKLEQIKKEGAINVLTRLHPTTYHKSSKGLTGLEFELIMLFAMHLGVKVNFIIPTVFSEILDKISSAQADIAAAGLTITPSRQKTMRFGPAYQNTSEQIVYRSGTKRPHTIADLSQGILEVAKGTSHIDSLIRLKSKYPDLSWDINSELSTDVLIDLVNEGLIDYTIIDSHQTNSIKQFYPKLYTAFDVSDKRQLAWALPFSNDNSLYDEVTLFFQQIEKDKTLKNLLDKYYGKTKSLGYVDNCTFRLQVKQRLPALQPIFQQEAKKNALDWKLLAAIGYQESHWRPKAKSPTGVKGIMMLTKKTAKQVGINDRTDPKQSIAGGAIYFKKILKKIPKRIQEPDRTWLALASYNIGYGHLEDARVLTEKRRGDPDKWLDVKDSLPLLVQKKWYKQTKYGYARGNEPVLYVENIRDYYSLLVWLTEDK